MSPSLVLKLPRELRDEIYRCLVPAELTVRPHKSRSTGRHWLSHDVPPGQGLKHYPDPVAPPIIFNGSVELYTIKALNSVNKQIRCEWRERLKVTTLGLHVDFRSQSPGLACDRLERLPLMLRDPDHLVKDITGMLNTFRSVARLEIISIHIASLLDSGSARIYSIHTKTRFQWRAEQRSVRVQPHGKQIYPSISSNAGFDKPLHVAEKETAIRLLYHGKTMFLATDNLAEPKTVWRLCEDLFHAHVPFRRRQDGRCAYDSGGDRDEELEAMRHLIAIRDAEDERPASLNTGEIIV